MSKAIKQTTLQKALTLNLDPQKYGAFAEIGAGQEVARYFFQAGRASNTVAKTLSAYDMVYSDELYGRESSGRYVCQARLQKMLDREFHLTESTLKKGRGENTCFFAFANTVATRSTPEASRCHGWIGVRFQLTPQSEPCDIVMHVRMLDRHRLQQQEILGILGVNLIYTAFYHMTNQDEVITNLVDNIKPGRVAIDMIQISGKDLSHLDAKLLNLELVRRKLTEAILFSPNGEITNLADVVYNKALFIQRGTYRPITSTSLEILDFGLKQFQKDFSTDSSNSLTLLELTMEQLKENDEINEKDFLDRVASLQPLGHHILVSSFFLFYPLKSFLKKFTKQPMAMTIGALHLERIFDEKYYEHLEGGLLEGVGTLLSGDTRMYVFPYKPDDSICKTAASFFPAEPMNHIYRYFRDSKKIVDIAGCEEIEPAAPSQEIRELMQKKDNRWEKLVPQAVVDLIKKDHLFNY